MLAAEHAGDVSSAKAAALAFVAGWQVEDMERLSEEIFDELMADRIWSGTRALAQLHLDAGQRVWLVTAAPVELGRIIAARLGLTGALGTVAEIRDGVYTGRLVGDLMHGPAKADGDHARSPPPKGSTWAAARRTATRSTTRRCCRGRARGRGQPRPALRREAAQARLGDPRLPHRPQGGEGRRAGRARRRRRGRRRRGRARAAPRRRSRGSLMADAVRKAL